MPEIKVENIEVGIMREATENVDPIVTASEVNKLGRYTLSPSGFPAYDVQTQPYYLPNASREPQGYLVNQKPIEETVTYELINGLGLFYALGKAVDNTTHTTISPAAVGTNKHSYTTRYKRTSQTLTEVKHVTGCKTNVFGASVDYTINNVWSIQQGFRGLALVDTVETPTITHPVGGSTNSYDIVSTIDWDAGSIKNEVMGIDWLVTDAAILLPPTLNTYSAPSMLHREHIYTLSLVQAAGKRTTQQDYVDDYTNNTTPIDIVVRHDQQATDNYFEFTFGGVTPAGKPQLDNEQAKLNLERYSFNFTTFSVDFKDGLAYGSYYA